MTSLRDKQVLDVLRASHEALGPTEIARRVAQPWCCKLIDGVVVYTKCSQVSNVLRRVGVHLGQGRWTAAATTPPVA